MALTSQGVSEICKKMTDDAIQLLGPDAEAQDMALEIIKLSEDDVNAVAEYVSECVQRHMFDHAVMEGGMSPNDFMSHILGVAIPTLLMVARGVYLTNPPQEDKYMATVSAELRLQTLVEEKTDLSAVWPAEFVSEITQVFDEPRMAFLAGVICGSSHG